MTAALALLPESGSERAAAATFLAEALAYVGRFDEAEAAIGEAASDRTPARRPSPSGLRGLDRLHALVAAGRRGGDGPARCAPSSCTPATGSSTRPGIEFLADAALALARTGAAEAAADYAERARERAEADGYPEIAWIATGAVAARWGDADAAERDAGRLRGLAPAGAARRVADAAAARPGGVAGAAPRPRATSPPRPTRRRPSSAASTFRPCTSPTWRRRWRPLAVAAGSQAAAAASEESESFVITLLGGFASQLRRPCARAAGGPPVDPGQAARADRAAAGRRRGDRGPVAGGRRVDRPPAAAQPAQPAADQLRRPRPARGRDPRPRPGRGRRARASSAAPRRRSRRPEQERPGLARTALARYKGELLPGDRYEPWATAPRERLQRRYLELLDLLAEDAVERGDVDEAIRLLDQAQVAEPLDEERYLRAAELLLFQGRRGSAQSLVERASAVREAARAGRVGAA